MGYGTLAIDYAKAFAKRINADYLRLLVVDVNVLAINLYIKNGFKKALGSHIETFDDGSKIYEYGYEIKIRR